MLDVSALFLYVRIVMKPTKAYILKIDTDISNEYAKTAADSCDKIGMPWEYFEGLQPTEDNDSPWEYVQKQGVKFDNKKPSTTGKPAMATAGHFLLWHKIREENDCAIILEHDAVLLHKVDIDIPDNVLVCLGYKVKDPENYNHEKVGPPSRLEERRRHGGAHAYALTADTANKLLENVNNGKRINHIDNQFFLTDNSRGDVKLFITDPIASLGWLRQSTIWGKSAVDNYQPILESFKENYKSNENLGEKKGGGI